MAVNCLLCFRSSLFPAFDAIQASHVVPAYREVIKQSEENLQALEQQAETCSWKILVHELEKITDQLATAWNIVRLLQYVKDSIEMRAAIKEIQAERVSCEVKLKQSRPLFNAFKAIRDSTSFAALDLSTKRIIEVQLNHAITTGAALEGSARARFYEIEQELERLSATFNQNVVDSKKRYGKLVTDISQLEGVPRSILRIAAQTAVSKGYEGATSENGPWLFDLGPTFASVMRNAKDRALREELYLAYLTTASDGELDNTPIINRTLQLRKEKAVLLGYANYAELAMLGNMATPETSQDMLEQLRSACWGKLEKEVEHLKSIKDAPEVLMPWDVAYLERLRAYNDFREDEVRPFFQLPKVLEGLFTLTRRLFSIEVTAADGLAPVWHEDVKFFALKNGANNETLGYFYLDAYSRPSEKRPGVSWTTNILVKSKFLAPEGCSFRLPVVAIICNMMPPAGPDEPALASLNEVRTLFHEFGHALEHLLASQQDALIGGHKEFDAVELPSLFMENWCYQWPELSTFACHYKTQEPLPPAIYEHLMTEKKLRHCPTSLLDLKLRRALVDLELHTSFDGSETVHDVNKRISLRSSIVPSVPQDRSLCSFIHIFTSSGYAAGFYSYTWSEMLSDDAFRAFEEAGFENEEDIQALGQRFRETVLGLAGSKPALEVFKRFRGREATIDAMAQKYGLFKESTQT